jgi:hypothetical protein
VIVLGTPGDSGEHWGNVKNEIAIEKMFSEVLSVFGDCHHSSAIVLLVQLVHVHVLFRLFLHSHLCASRGRHVQAEQAIRQAGAGVESAVHVAVPAPGHGSGANRP